MPNPKTEQMWADSKALSDIVHPILMKVDQLSIYYHSPFKATNISFVTKLDNAVGTFNCKTYDIKILSGRYHSAMFGTILHELGHYIDLCVNGHDAVQYGPHDLVEYRAWCWAEKFMIMWPECFQTALVAKKWGVSAIETYLSDRISNKLKEHGKLM